ncbi:MAG: hypothetical protein HY072_00440, partial [Deltaproteobacteria bacterium]|nr:hypothetical protein [Deltaproteobacteria bacterium]
FPREHPEDGSCEYRDRCEIKSFMSSLNQRMVQFLANIRLSELEEFYSNNNGKDLAANIPVNLLVSQKEALKV